MVSTIYCGPNDKKLGLRQHQIFSGELPSHVRDALKASPGLANHLLPFDEFVKRTPPGTPKKSSKPTATVRLAPPIRNHR